jgi:hypothetical protein
MKHLHIVSFDNPYPPNYGGAIDVFYKIKSLKEIGIRITLHAYEYGRKHDSTLLQLCDEVHYYHRSKQVKFSLPYIVSSRNDAKLLTNLLKDNAPILFEGLHSCLLLKHPQLRNRKKMVRMHNIEHHYYQKLAKVERNLLKRLYFYWEARQLKKFEPVLHSADYVLAISANDYQYLKPIFPNTQYIPPFHANGNITCKDGLGDYAFYHGNLSVGENDEAAKFLVQRVFNNIDYPLIIAGNASSHTLRKLIEVSPNVTLLEGLTTDEISKKIKDAHINIIPTFQDTGIKLKLINVLYQGRHVLANNCMVSNTGVEKLCHIAESKEDFIKQIEGLRSLPFTQETISERAQVLSTLFNNIHSAEVLAKLI